MTETQQHIDWCKQRALEYLCREELELALSSMISDMMKNEEAARRLDQFIMKAGQLHVQNSDMKGLRSWIEGF